MDSVNSAHHKTTDSCNRGADMENNQRFPQSGYSNSLSMASSSLIDSMRSDRNPALHPTREDSPYPGREELAAATTLHSLAETAASASLQLQQQINLMAQAMAMQSGTANVAPTSATPNAFPLLATTTNAPLLSVGTGIGNNGDPTASLSSMLNQYVAAVSTAVAIQQHQQPDVVSAYNTSSHMAGNYGPLTAYIAAQQQQQNDNSAATVCHRPTVSTPQVSSNLQLIQQQQNSPLSAMPNVAATVQLAPAPQSVCSCSFASMMATATPLSAATVCVCSQHPTQAVHPQRLEQRDLNNNEDLSNSAEIVEPDVSMSLPLLTQQQRQAAQIFQIPNPGYQQQQRHLQSQATNVVQSGLPIGVVQPLNAVITLNSSSINRISRSSGASGSSSSLKRPSAVAFSDDGAEIVTGAISSSTAATTISLNNDTSTATPQFSSSSPLPPIIYAQNSSQIRLNSEEVTAATFISDGRQQQRTTNDFIEGSSRTPKLRRIISLDDEVSGVDEALSEVSESSIATTAALVEFQQRAQPMAAISLPSSLNAQSTYQQPSQQQHQQIPIPVLAIAAGQQQTNAAVDFIGANGALRHQPPSQQPLLNQQVSAAAAAVAAASTISSVAAGMEQIVAAALSAANAASALSPQALAAITGATAAVQCAVCAAAACQSRLSNPGAVAAAVTACSCLHHHHHHLHCHHHQTLQPPLSHLQPQQPSAVCTLCNSGVGNGAPTPSMIGGSMVSTTSGNANNLSIVGVVGQPMQQHQGHLHQSHSSNGHCPSSSLSVLSSLAPNLQISCGVGNSTGDSATHQNSQQQQQRFLLNANNNSTLSSGGSTGGGEVIQQQFHFGMGGGNANASAQQVQQSSFVNIGINVGASNLLASGASSNAIAPPCDAGASTHSLMNVQQAAAAAAALSPSAVTAMLLNSAAAMGQQQTLASVPTQQQQQMPSLYSLQRSATLNENGLAAAVAAAQAAHIQAAHQNMSTVQQNLLANRIAQQERERETANQFYQQQQIRQRAAVAAAAAAAQHRQLMRPLVMMPQGLPVQMTQMDLSSLVLLHPGTEAALVLNGGGASALAHATNPHHIVANAMTTATAPEPQPVGATLEQIKKHSQKLSYVEDPDIPEQERERCTVCLCEFETGDELRGLNCGHLFHMECIDPWLQQNKKCPLCRVDMDRGVGVPGSSNTLMDVNAATEVVLNAVAYAQASATSSTTC